MKRLFSFLLCVFSLSAFGAATINPSDYLASLPKYPPNTNSGLPRVTQFGFYTANPLYNEYRFTWKELADDFGYTIPLFGYANAFRVNLATNNGTDDHLMVLIVSNNPSFYKLSVVPERVYQSPPTGFYVTNSAGQFTDGSNAWTGASSFVAPMSWECPTNYLTSEYHRWMAEILPLTNVCPVSYMPNGGEYGIQYPFRFQPTTGAGKNNLDAERLDPRVQARTNSYPSGGAGLGPWLSQVYNDRMSNDVAILWKEVTNAFPSITYFIFTTVAEQYRYTPSWAINNAHYAEAYAFNNFVTYQAPWTYYEPQQNNYWTNHANNSFGYAGPTAGLFEEFCNGMDALNLLGKSNSITWFTAGYSDSDLTRFGNIDIQAGLMKSEMMVGSIGFCMGGFDTVGMNCSVANTNQYQPFATNCPSMWILQVAQAGYVHNFATRYDTYFTNGVVLSDHASIMSTDRPALWLTNSAAITNAYVTCRKINSNLWLACAWAADGITNSVTANIPNGPTVVMQAIGRGKTYLITSNSVSQIDGNVPYWNGSAFVGGWSGYVSQGGTPDGVTNSLAWFNSGTNTLGDVVFTGTFTNLITINQNGTPVTPLRLIWDSSAQWVWPTVVEGGSIISGSGTHDIVIDGAYLQTTSNRVDAVWAAPYFTNTFNGILLTVSTNVEIKNCTMIDFCPRASNIWNLTTAPTAIKLLGAMQNVLVHNNNITNTGNCVVIGPQTGVNTNIQVYSNVMWGCSWGVYCEPASSGSMIYNTQIWANRINNGIGWDSGPGGSSPFHQDGIIVGVPNTSTNFNMQIYRNWIGPLGGFQSTTSPIFYETTQNAEFNRGGMIYNNIIAMTAGQVWNSGAINWNGVDTLIANNTIDMDGTQLVAGGGARARVFNNLTINGTTRYFISGGFTTNCATTTAATTNMDYNVAMTATYWWNPGSYTFTDYTTLAGSPYFCGGTYDHHSLNRATFSLNANYSAPPGDTNIVGIATNLVSLFSTDFGGNGRPSIGTWTVGAWEGTAIPSTLGGTYIFGIYR